MFGALGDSIEESMKSPGVSKKSSASGLFGEDDLFSASTSAAAKPSASPAATRSVRCIYC